MTDDKLVASVIAALTAKRNRKLRNIARRLAPHLAFDNIDDALLAAYNTGVADAGKSLFPSRQNACRAIIAKS